MLNFYNLSASDFVELSRDILQKITGIPMEATDSVNDHGADIRDTIVRPQVVAQVKHYRNSTMGHLVASLRKEVSNVAAMRPKQYYLFISKDFTEDRMKEIIELFSDCVLLEESHIFTLSRLDTLLQRPDYREILQKHPNLWNFSIDVLGDAVLLGGKSYRFNPGGIPVQGKRLHPKCWHWIIRDADMGLFTAAMEV